MLGKVVTEVINQKHSPENYSLEKIARNPVSRLGSRPRFVGAIGSGPSGSVRVRSTG